MCEMAELHAILRIHLNTTGGMFKYSYVMPVNSLYYVECMFQDPECDDKWTNTFAMLDGAYEDLQHYLNCYNVFW